MRATDTDGSVDCTQLFVAWDDTVREHWPQGRVEMLSRLLKFYRFYIGGGAMRRLFRLQQRFAWTIATPLVYGLGVIVSILLLAAVTSFAFMALWPQASPLVGGSIAVAVGVATGGLALRWAEQLKLFWLIRIFLFVQRWASGDEELEAKWKVLAHTIARDMADNPSDEHVLLAHSVGAMVAMPVLATLAEVLHCREAIKHLSVVTYGQVNPLLTLSDGPGVDRFRRQAKVIAAMDLPWLDLSAPGDALCCALTSPFTSAEGPDRPVNLTIKSARFDLRYDAETYRKLKHRPFDLHFEYFRSTTVRHAFQHFDLLFGRGTWANRLKPERMA